MMNRTVVTQILLVFVLALFCACGTTKSAQTDDGVAATPGDAQHKAPPAGPEIVGKSVRPRGDSAAKPVEAEDGASPLQRREIASFRRRGPAYLLTLLAFEPVHGTDGFKGFKIVNAAPNAKSFMTPHVKLGDVITHVNGIRVERPDDYLQAWNTLEEASVIRVDFFREDQPMHVSWVVKE